MPRKKTTEKKLSKKESKEESQKRKIKLLKIIIEDLINKQSVEIIDLLAGKKNVNEFSIAKNLDLTINQTRNILYKLSDFGLVSFIRKKDKRKGWYIYFWTLNTHQALSLLDKNLNKKLELIKNQTKNRSEGRHYTCMTCTIEVTEETALLNDFICPECEEVYELSDDSELIGELKKKVTKIEKELLLVVEEKNIEEEKLNKEKARKIKKVEDEKKAKRAAAAAERKAKKLEEEKKLGKTKKKPVKKKATKKKPVKKKATKKKPVKKKATKKKPVKKK
jgi:transcription factor E